MARAIRSYASLRYSYSKLSPHLLVPRKSAKKFIFVIAGYQRQSGQRWSDSEALRVVEQFDSYKQEWKILPSIKHPVGDMSQASKLNEIVTCPTSLHS